MKDKIKLDIVSDVVCHWCIIGYKRLEQAITELGIQDKIELETTTIKGNKELPKILYIVPWQDIKKSKKAERKLVLHSLFGDLFDPVLPNQSK